MAHWPYNTPQWELLRARKLRDKPFCEQCLAQGKYWIGTHVDHVIAVSKGGDAFPPLEGLMTFCQACYDSKTSAVDHPGGSGVALKDCDENGLPLDPQHHAGGSEGYTGADDKQSGGKDQRHHRAQRKRGQGRPRPGA